MEGAWLGKYDTIWEVVCDSIKKRMEIFLPFLPNDSWLSHIFFPEIHDWLFYVSASTPE